MAAVAPSAYPSAKDNRGPLLLRTVWVLISMSTVVVFGRIYTKWRKTRRLYWDDYLVILALIFGLVHAATVSAAVQKGFGRHLIYLDTVDRTIVLRNGALTLLWAYLSPMTGRIAFCVSMLFLTGTDPRMKKYGSKFLWVVIFLQLAVNISAIIAFFAQCGTHVTLLWTALEHVAEYETDCSNAIIQTDIGYFLGSFNTLTDAFLTAMPALLIEHTRLPLRRKIGLSFLLCLSAVAMIASIVKTYGAKALSQELDFTYDLCPYVVWLSVELNVVIIVSSIPFLRPIFQQSRQHSHHRNPQRMELKQMSNPPSFGSRFSSKLARSTLSRVDSQENIIEPQETQYPPPVETGIQVTHEVSVTYETTDAAYVHGWLVGLVQGDIENPRPAR